MHHCRLYQPVPPPGASHHTLDRRREDRPREPDHRVLVPPPDRHPRPRPPNRPQFATPTKTPPPTPDPRPTLARTSKNPRHGRKRTAQTLRYKTRDLRLETRTNLAPSPRSDSSPSGGGGSGGAADEGGQAVPRPRTGLRFRGGRPWSQKHEDAFSPPCLGSQVSCLTLSYPSSL